MAAGAPVPVPNAPSVLPTASGRTFGPTIQGGDSDEFGAAGARQIEGLGATMTDVAVQAQQQANAARVTGALNQLTQQRMTLTSDPDEGYMRLRGEQALQPQDNGMSMPDAYAQKLADGANSIAANLTPMQQQLFFAKAAPVLQDFHGAANRYWADQQATYTAQNTRATIDNAQQLAALHYSDPATVDESHNQAEDAVRLQAQAAGWSDAQTQDELRTALSGVTMSALHAAIADGNTQAATAMFNAYKQHLTPDALVEGASIINRQADTHAALSAADATLAAYRSQLAPSTLDAVHAAAGAPSNVDDATWQRVLQAESGNHDTNADGSPVTSPKGARGAAQVMPATASNPGFGVPPSDGTAAGDRQLGRAYLGAMVQRYGDLPQALAAYNAGPGAVDTAIAQAKKDGDPSAWLSHLPAETQGYVQKIAGSATMPATFAPPKLGDLLADVDQRLGPNATPQQRQLAEGEVTRQYQVALHDHQQQGADLEHQAQSWLLENRGDLAGMPAALRQQIVTQAPDAWSRLSAFAKVVTPGAEPVKTDPQVYADLIQNPDKLALMSNAQVLNLRTSLSPTDWKSLVDKRAALVNGTTNLSPHIVDDQVLANEFNMRMREIGIDPTSKTLAPADRKAADNALSFIRSQVLAEQVAVGKKFEPQQLRDSIDRLFAQNVHMAGGGWFKDAKPQFSASPVGSPLDGMAAEDRQRLRDAFRAHGVASPTDSQMLAAYRAFRTRTVPSNPRP